MEPTISTDAQNLVNLTSQSLIKLQPEERNAAFNVLRTILAKQNDLDVQSKEMEAQKITSIAETWKGFNY